MREEIVSALATALAWTAGGGCPYVVLGAECRASIADFTLADTPSVSCTVNPAVGLGWEFRSSFAVFALADTPSVSCTVNPAVEIGWPTRISSGWHLMW